MLTEIARLISIFMVVPILILDAIIFIIDGYNVKKGILIVVYFLLGIQIAALLYRIVG